MNNPENECRILSDLIAKSIERIRHLKSIHAGLRAEYRPLVPGSVLNAYRNGDVSFGKAVDLLGSKEPVIRDAKRIGSDVHVDLQYPRSEGSVQSLVIGLIDVRASDEIRVSYDFDRDGWNVEQRKDWDTDPRQAWFEVAFVESWALHEDEGESDG